MKSQGAKLSFSSVSVRWGRTGAFARRVSSRPQGTEAKLFPCPGKQKPCVSTQPEPAACVRGPNADTNTVRELPGAAARACAAFSSYLSPFPVWLFPLKILFLCRSCRDGHPIFFPERKWGKRTAMGRDSAPFEPPFQRPAADLPFPRAAGRLSGPLGRKPPAGKGNA